MYHWFLRLSTELRLETPLKSMCPPAASRKPASGAVTRTHLLRAPRATAIPKAVIMVKIGCPKEV